MGYILDFRYVNFNLTAKLCRLCNTVEDGLVVDDLRGRNRCGGAVLASIQEGADLAVEQRRTVVFDDRNFSDGLLAANLVINLHGSADGAIPAVGRRNAQATLGT